MRVSLKQPMGFQFAYVIAELRKRIGLGLEVEGFEKGLMEMRGSPGGDGGTGVDKDLHQADQASVMDFDSGDLGLAGDDGESQTLEEREIDMDLESLRLKRGEAVRDGEEFCADGGQMLNSLFKQEIFQVIATDFDPQEGEKFFILFDEGMFEVRA